MEHLNIFMIKICVMLNEGQGQYIQHVMHSPVWGSHPVSNLIAMVSLVSESSEDGVWLPTWRAHRKRSYMQSSHPVNCTCICTGVGAHAGWPSECLAEECYNNWFPRYGWRRTVRQTASHTHTHTYTRTHARAHAQHTYTLASSKLTFSKSYKNKTGEMIDLFTPLQFS